MIYDTKAKTFQEKIVTEFFKIRQNLLFSSITTREAPSKLGKLNLMSLPTSMKNNYIENSISLHYKNALIRMQSYNSPSQAISNNKSVQISSVRNHTLRQHSRQ